MSMFYNFFIHVVINLLKETELNALFFHSFAQSKGYARSFWKRVYSLYYSFYYNFELHVFLCNCILKFKEIRER